MRCYGLIVHANVFSCFLVMNVSFHPGFAISVSWSLFDKNFKITHVHAGTCKEISPGLAQTEDNEFYQNKNELCL